MIRTVDNKALLEFVDASVALTYRSLRMLVAAQTNPDTQQRLRGEAMLQEFLHYYPDAADK